MSVVDNAIAILENELACVRRAESCDRACEKCDLIKDTSEIIEGYNEAIFALKHYAEIREIVGRWGSDYYAKKSRGDYFLEITETFRESADDR